MIFLGFFIAPEDNFYWFLSPNATDTSPSVKLWKKQGEYL
jgi:hypothetical protein